MKEPDVCYQQDYALLAQAFPDDDARRIVTVQARDITERILDEWAKQNGKQSFEFDVIQERVLRVPTELGESYYRIALSDKRYFANCMLAVSSFVFGPAFDEPKPDQKMSKSMRMALSASIPIRQQIRQAMKPASVSAAMSAMPPRNPLERLMARPAGVGVVDDDRIHAELFGMVLGFTPTNVLAAGNILETLLRYPAFMAHVVDAALRDDDDLLWSCLRETLRFRNINIGPLRRCAETSRVVGRGGASTLIHKGERILACSPSAMFDERQVRSPPRWSDVGDPGRHWSGPPTASIHLAPRSTTSSTARKTPTDSAAHWARLSGGPIRATVSIPDRKCSWRSATAIASCGSAAVSPPPDRNHRACSSCA